jgi:hypothetical protein
VGELAQAGLRVSRPVTVLSLLNARSIQKSTLPAVVVIDPPVSAVKLS